MEQSSLFDLPLGRIEKQRGIARTTQTNAGWMDWAIDQVLLMKNETQLTVTGEQIRLWCETRENALHPVSPHAWGALTSHAVRLGILRDTGRVSHMKAVKSHARRTPIWEFV